MPSYKQPDHNVVQKTTFDELKFSLIARPREHKQKKWINMLIRFPLPVSSSPNCQAEFLYIEESIAVTKYILPWEESYTH